MPASVMLRGARCARCGTLALKAFIVGERYVCDSDRCLSSVLRDLGIKKAQVATLMTSLRAEFDTTYG